MTCDRKLQVQKYVQNIPEMLAKKRSLEGKYTSAGESSLTPGTKRDLFLSSVIRDHNSSSNYSPGSPNIK